MTPTSCFILVLLYRLSRPIFSIYNFGRRQVHYSTLLYSTVLACLFFLLFLLLRLCLFIFFLLFLLQLQLVFRCTHMSCRPFFLLFFSSLLYYSNSTLSNLPSYRTHTYIHAHAHTHPHPPLTLPSHTHPPSPQHTPSPLSIHTHAQDMPSTIKTRCSPLMWKGKNGA